MMSASNGLTRCVICHTVLVADKRSVTQHLKAAHTRDELRAFIMASPHAARARMEMRVVGAVFLLLLGVLVFVLAVGLR